MKVGWKLGVYIGVSTGVGIIFLVAIFIAIRYYIRKRTTKKHQANGIISQLNLPHQVPDFTIPLMLPMLVQSNLAKKEGIYDPIKETCALGTNAASLVQPCDDFVMIEDEEDSGPVIRRLESVMDVSMFPEQDYDENRLEATGPWTSSRRESLFFPYLFSTKPTTKPSPGAVGTLVATATAESPCNGSASPSPSPSPAHKFERRYTERIRTHSTSSNPDQTTGSLRSRIRSDAASIRRMTPKPILVKKTSCPDSTTTSSRLSIKKRFGGDSYNRQMSSDSLLGSMKSSTELPASRRGNLSFSIKYNKEDKKLKVHLVNAVDLPMKNNNLLDSFAKLYLIMPSKQLRQQSKVHKKTCNPIYDETFVFDDIDDTELQQAHLRIKILQRDGFSSEMVGELSIGLNDDAVVGGALIQRGLLPRAKSFTEDGPGELLVSVCHHATTAQLKVLIIKMRDLPKSCKNPSVTVELVYQDELLQRQQTTKPKKPRKKNVFKEELVFHIPTNSSNPLENYSLQFSIFSQDILKGAVCIGYVTLGMDAPRESEIEHWRAVVTSPHKIIKAMHRFHRTPV